MTNCRFLFAVVLLSLTACATSDVAIPGAADDTAATDPTGAPAAAYLEQAADFTIAEFVDQSPASLERIFGAPALVRTEGVGQFRRYDTPRCRLYALVLPDAGGRPVIKSLNIAGLTPGAPAPVFPDCFLAE